MIGATLSQPGTLVLYRYIDDARQVQADAAGQSIALSADAPGVLAVLDGRPCASYRVQILNSINSTEPAAVTKFAALLATH